MGDFSTFFGGGGGVGFGGGARAASADGAAANIWVNSLGPAASGGGVEAARLENAPVARPPWAKGAAGAAGLGRFADGAGSVANIRVNSPGVCGDRVGGGGIAAALGAGAGRRDESVPACIMRVNSPTGWTGAAAGFARNGSAANGDCIMLVNSPGALLRGDAGGGGGGVLTAAGAAGVGP